MQSVVTFPTRTARLLPVNIVARLCRKEKVLSAIVVLSFFGCQYRDVRDSNEKLTRSRLQAAGCLVKQAMELGVGPRAFDSWEGFLARLVEQHLLDKAECDSMFKKDAWGRPFHMQVEQEGHEVVVRVVSGGADGEPRSGNTGNLFVEIRVKEGEEPEIHLGPQ